MEVTSKPTKTTQTVEEAPMDPGSSCVPVAILAGVAVGCFTSGAIVMWLFLVVVWSKTNSKCGKEIPVESNLAGSYRTQEGTPSLGRHENSPARMMSISHQRLLSSTSIDSGMSSQIVSPPSFPAVAPVTDTIPNRQTDADIGSDYTRLNRESSQYTGENPQETDRNDYARLMTAEVPNISSPVQNPYMDLQTANQSETDQSETSAQSNQTDTQSAPDTCVTYPSISRSNKSDVHDYESIFSEGASNAAGTDYMEFSSRRGSDGDYHEYHECGSERHEYFILETQTNDYFVLEKES